MWQKWEMLRLCEVIFLIELRMFLIYIIVNPTKVDMPQLKFPKPGEDFKITCTVGKYILCFAGAFL